MVERAIVNEVNVSSVMTKSQLPVGGYSVNPYVGCEHACRYCYASFMKRFTSHPEPWGEFVDVKYWKPLKNPHKYDGQRVVIGSVTDGYQPVEKIYQRTRAILEELQESTAKILVCTRSGLVTRDLDILRKLKDVTVAFSLASLDDGFIRDMEHASTVKRRLDALKEVYDAGIRTVCFISPIFPGITDPLHIIEQVRDRCDYIWLENLNLRGGFKADILSYIGSHYPELLPLYQDIYTRKNYGYWDHQLEVVKQFARKNNLELFDNYLPDNRMSPGKPGIINYLYHEQIKGTDNTGTRRARRIAD